MLGMLSNWRMHSSYSSFVTGLPSGRQKISSPSRLPKRCPTFLHTKSSHSAQLSTPRSMAHGLAWHSVSARRPSLRHPSQRTLSAADNVRRVLLVTEYTPPPVDQSLPDRRVVGSRRTQMAVVPTVADHLVRHHTIILSIESRT